jgi:tetratricopeptide (TPR) repeat protein
MGKAKGEKMEENKEKYTGNLEFDEYLQMSQVLLGAEKYSEAIGYLDKILEAEPMNAAAYITKGIAFASIEEYEKAKECFKRCIKIDKKFADAYFQLGNVEFLLDNFQEGVKNYNQAVSYGFKDASLYYNLALVYEEQDNVEEAIRYYSKAAAIDETNAEYLIRKATLQISISKYEEALQTLERIRNRFPESFEGYHLSAAALTLLERYDEADTILKDALLLFPDDKAIMFDRLRILITKGDMEEALLMLDKAKDSDTAPEIEKEILLNEAKIRGQMDQLDQTVELLDKALLIKEGEYLDSEIQYLLLNALFIKKNFEKMYVVADKVDKDSTEDPYNLAGMYYLCIAAKGRGDADYKNKLNIAVKYYRNISLKDPSRVDAYLFRAMCYRELEDYVKAMESVNYVLLLQPDNAQLHQIKGNLLLDQGKKGEAQLEYAEAKRLGLSQNFIDLMGGV